MAVRAAGRQTGCLKQRYVEKLVYQHEKRQAIEKGRNAMTPEKKQKILSAMKTAVSAILAIVLSACLFYIVIFLLQAAIGLFLSLIAAAAIIVIALILFGIIREKLGD